MEDKEGLLLRLFTPDKWDVDEATGCWNWNRFVHFGYGKISTRLNNVSFGCAASRVALRKKLGRPIQKGMLACHTCDNPRCVNPDHVYEGTPKQNTDDMMARNRHNDSFKKGGLATRKLTRGDAEDIRRYVAEGGYQADMARKYGVSVTTISDIVTGKKYGFDGMQVPHKTARARRNLSDDQVRDIRRRVQAGEVMRTIELDLGIGGGTVSRIMSGKLYSDVA